MSVSLITTGIFNADMAAISAEVRQIREAVLVADISLAREEADGIEPSEIVTRYIAARGDHSTRHWLRGLAKEHDAAQRFGPRLIDELNELDALSGRYDQAA
ncbi:hypothetical protein OG784_12900 [Streptomyces sp. NBC_01617]|uniref:hypothetical protein n=1 Tax=Streptomyces sp. NBC_01617 TaxID=2975899 RepID=UPI00386F3269|nr:hypothetical protein OG784_12900 [Streptomyces sp. NBC_01617]